MGGMGVICVFVLYFIIIIINSFDAQKDVIKFILNLCNDFGIVLCD